MEPFVYVESRKHLVLHTDNDDLWPLCNSCNYEFRHFCRTNGSDLFSQLACTSRFIHLISNLLDKTISHLASIAINKIIEQNLLAVVCIEWKLTSQ